jgi:hypothetical protein
VKVLSIVLTSQSVSAEERELVHFRDTKTFASGGSGGSGVSGGFGGGGSRSARSFEFSNDLNKLKRSIGEIR